jgi:5-methylcytosine-specific restriction endonuclease McrA
MAKHSNRALVLNADFMPHSIISWRRALILTIIEEVDAIEFYNDFILDCQSRKHPIPAVVRLKKYVRRKNKSLPFSRKNIFIRDQMTCQYCGNQYDPQNLTYDHIVPRSKWNSKNGTPTNWQNIVTCCFKCNQRKNNKSLKESNMRLLREPKVPGYTTQIIGLSPWGDIPMEWKTYIPNHLGPK